jgi:mannose-6-phosphate isomerase-like protein (cupin superfamily)
MVIAPGDSEGGPRNRHRGADQWLFVISGTGRARVNGKRYALRAGSLLVIERADEHEITATGREPLRTLNVYVPPAYTQSGDELPAGKR